MHKSTFGSFAFALGFLVALFLGILGALSSALVWFLIGIGVLIGVVNWLWNDPKPFLMASFAIVVVGQFGPRGLIDANTMLAILDRLVIVFLPVVLINALKLVFDKMYIDKIHK
jgi:hypothetical protein